MRVYLASTADELQDFLHERSLDIPEVYAPTPMYFATHSEMDEEEIEFSLSLLAAEDAIELTDEQSGAPVVIAFEIPESMLGSFDEVSANLNSPLLWEMVEAIFIVGSDPEDLTWFAPQETESMIADWLTR